MAASASPSSTPARRPPRVPPSGLPPLDPAQVIDFGSREFSRTKLDLYPRMLEAGPVVRGRIFFIKLFAVTGHRDCIDFVKDPRFVRNRTNATGGRRVPIPLPRPLRAMAYSMILEDDPQHRRLRGLVNRAFTPRAIAPFESRIDALSHELLDKALAKGARAEIDLIEDYAQPIPMAVIAQMVGVSDEDVGPLKDSVRVLSKGFGGWTVLRTLLFDLRRAERFIRELVDRKRRAPGDDILSNLVHAEEEGDRLSDDELVAMAFLLIIAGFETTTHLIGNSVISLLDFPDQLDRLRRDPALMPSAVEELLRHSGPIHSTKLNYAVEDTTLHGVAIPKGGAVVPLIGCANRDPRVFEGPDRLDLARDPNPHLAFSHGPHFCLGAQLARLETSVALRNLLDRAPDLRLAIPREQLEPVRMALWHRHERIQVALR